MASPKRGHVLAGGPGRTNGTHSGLAGKCVSAPVRSASRPQERHRRLTPPLVLLPSRPQHRPPTMRTATLLAPLLLLPYASAAVHKMQLKKMAQPTALNPEAEAAHLATKYGGSQTPLTSNFAAPGRFAPRPTKDENGDELFWTQGKGHNVPLNSATAPLTHHSTRTNIIFRLPECAVLFGDYHWQPAADGKLVRAGARTALLTFHYSSRSFWTPARPTSGCRAPSALPLRASCTPSTTHRRPRPTPPTAPSSPFVTAPVLLRALSPRTTCPLVTFLSRDSSSRKPSRSPVLHLLLASECSHMCLLFRASD